VKVSFEERGAVGRVRRDGVRVGSTDIAQNGRIETSSKSSATNVGVSTNPVVGDGLVGIQDERIPLAGEDLDAVNSVRSVIYTVNLNDSLASSNRSRFD
jgi:hypothetical protein